MESPENDVRQERSRFREYARTQIFATNTLTVARKKKRLKIESAKSRDVSFQFFKDFSQFEVATREKRNGKIISLRISS
jgi:hypothetical protein